MKLLELFQKAAPEVLERIEQVCILATDAAELLKEFAEHRSITEGDVVGIKEWLKRYEELIG